MLVYAHLLFLGWLCEPYICDNAFLYIFRFGDWSSCENEHEIVSNEADPNFGREEEYHREPATMVNEKNISLLFLRSFLYYQLNKSHVTKLMFID